MLRLDDMVVSIHNSRDIGRIRKHRQQAMEIEILQRDGEVLQHIMIIIVRIDLHTHAILRLQLQIGRNTLVIP